ncbi:MAG: phenylalanine--tRNA ligase subunit alpha [Thermoprotei archaeon]|nr:MAG: phenylalanine--tRNA ligase subunit alpha [Thermoprotei archaeon]
MYLQGYSFDEKVSAVEAGLSSLELKVLRKLSELGGMASADDLTHACQIDRSSLMSALNRLSSRDLLELEKTEEELFDLTSEGRVYAEQKLPEQRLYEELTALGGAATPQELSARLKVDERSLTIALGWARRKGWVSIEGRLVKAKKANPEEDEDHRVLRELSRRGLTPASELNAYVSSLSRLKERKLVQAKCRSTFKVKLTEHGKRFLEELAEVPLEVTALTPDLLKSGLWSSVRFKPYNVMAEPPIIYPGKKHPYLMFLEEVRKVLLAMGFEEQDGPFVETEFWNFDVLFQAQDHPAREIHDSFRVKKPNRGCIEIKELEEKVQRVHEDGWITGSTGWRYRWDPEVARRLVLRTQTTAVSMRYLATHPTPPVRMFCLSKVFRPDVLDAKHSMEFMQLEGIYGDVGVSLRHLLGVIEGLASALGLGEVKFKPGYFPFTEPSVEGFIKHPKLGWVEFVGAGMFRPEVLKPLGIDFPVAAWGIGIERLAMVVLDIDDIRELHTRRLEWLRSRPLYLREVR